MLKPSQEGHAYLKYTYIHKLITLRFCIIFKDIKDEMKTTWLELILIHTICPEYSRSDNDNLLS